MRAVAVNVVQVQSVSEEVRDAEEKDAAEHGEEGF